MGEQADYIIEQMLNGNYHSGYIKSKQKRILKCKLCESTEVYWHQYDSGKWFLFDKETKKSHVCIVDRELYIHKIPIRHERDTVKDTLRGMKAESDTMQKYLESPRCPKCGVKIGFSHDDTECGCAAKLKAGIK